MLQQTIKKAINLQGIGVHSGKNSTVKIKPAEENTGVVFVRKDLNDYKIKADYSLVQEAVLCTKITQDNVHIYTIEHLMSALNGLNITNIEVDMYGEEFPILDGSAKQIAALLQEVGVTQQKAKRLILQITNKIHITVNGNDMTFEPSSCFELEIYCNFIAKGLKTDKFVFNECENSYIQDIAPARTFGFLSDVQYVKANNLALGSSLENTVVFGDDGIALNKEGIRFSDEPMRHKALDIMGDLYLSPYKIIGKLKAFSPGHFSNNQMMQAIFNNPNNYVIIE